MRHQNVYKHSKVLKNCTHSNDAITPQQRDNSAFMTWMA